jgi:hypothetical protein
MSGDTTQGTLLDVLDVLDVLDTGATWSRRAPCRLAESSRSAGRRSSTG